VTLEEARAIVAQGPRFWGLVERLNAQAFQLDDTPVDPPAYPEEEQEYTREDERTL